nr:radical SAM protein [Roseofilum sp. Belize Diploria]
MMSKCLYAGYSEGEGTVVREKFGRANIYQQNARSILTQASGYIGAYDFTLNPYRGCQYGCSYCYAAAFSPNQKMRQDWGNWAIVKKNSVELLEQDLERWYKTNPDRAPTIYMSSVTDPYQPIESKQQLTRQLLAVMVRYQPTLVIQTRSPMIVRDMDLLQQFKRLRINMSIPTGSEQVRKDFEPKSPSIPARLKAIAKLRYGIPYQSGHEIKFSVTITPLLPIFAEHIPSFIQKLALVDRVVIQAFHQNSRKSLVASTREQAIALKDKYDWWYRSEQEHYSQFQQQLIVTLQEYNVEVREGKDGFTYD